MSDKIALILGEDREGSEYAFRAKDAEDIANHSECGCHCVVYVTEKEWEELSEAGEAVQRATSVYEKIIERFKRAGNG